MSWHTRFQSGCWIHATSWIHIVEIHTLILIVVGKSPQHPNYRWLNPLYCWLNPLNRAGTKQICLLNWIIFRYPTMSEVQTPFETRLPNRDYQSKGTISPGWMRFAHWWFSMAGWDVHLGTCKGFRNIVGQPIINLWFGAYNQGEFTNLSKCTSRLATPQKPCWHMMDLLKTACSYILDWSGLYTLARVAIRMRLMSLKRAKGQEPRTTW